MCKKTNNRTTSILAFALMICLFLFTTGENTKQGNAGKLEDYEISGPYVHKNLSIFLVHGKYKIDAKNVLTLGEALEQKKVVVYETSQVDQLEVKNISKDSAVYIQSGDIVKGGKQDRVLRYDVVIPPESEKMRISSYCIVASSWRARQ